MQIRCVPEEELAVGPDGKRLPFAIVTQEERRKFVEETGPFGNSRRGRARSRAATTAKKADPNIGFFEIALNQDLSKRLKEVEHQPSSISSSSSQPKSLPQSTTTVLVPLDGAASTAAPSGTVHRQLEPTEVMLYGYKSSFQYLAIQRYEMISRGYICEDYPRDPPTEYGRFRTVHTYSSPRALTPEERRKVNAYAGGESWIKVTFDSAQAADRAVADSPQQISGYWVYAALYRGIPPLDDRPIPIQYLDTGSTDLRRPRPTRNPSASFSAPSLAAATNTPFRARETLTLPRGFTTNITSPASETISSFSSSTASSATATGFSAPTIPSSVSYPELNAVRASDNEHCRFIPEARRIKLRPAEEALLPTRTTAQWLTSYLPFSSFFSGQIIGDQVPRGEDGQFDYKGASIYWRFWYWFDHYFQTDFCGLKEE
ncbi:MAG: hypothetical protein M1816_007374 [Peltula sp. TS41687]|nr:MAG: hypothetical protein M1816_007374 [Peltula sp. TS41687]